jgi:hypothetical protein
LIIFLAAQILKVVQFITETVAIEEGHTVPVSELGAQP